MGRCAGLGGGGFAPVSTVDSNSITGCTQHDSSGLEGAVSVLAAPCDLIRSPALGKPATADRPALNDMLAPARVRVWESVQLRDARVAL
jgi:hypothetical protein